MTSPTAHTPWSGMLPVDDTALAVSDTGGDRPPVVYLNGSYADRSHWRGVVAHLGGSFRHITYDERARGGSRPSADYTFEACLRDLDSVLTARGIERPLLVGWSYGAIIAAHWLHRHPNRAAAAVSVDGAYPSGWTDEASHERIRTLFRRLSPLFLVARPLGLAARMSAAQHAEINIEVHRLHAALGPVLDEIERPFWYVKASGDSLGDRGGELEQMRGTLDPHLERNPHLRVAARVGSNHGKILRKDSLTVARTVRELHRSLTAG